MESKSLAIAFLTQDNVKVGENEDPLLAFYEEYGYEKNDKTYIYVKLTHYDIASLIGSTRETTTSTLNDFKREGLIDFDGRKLVILDKEGLEKRTSA
jgi:CRP/FNR family transcriptional regulator